jgi:hypothetical protein
MENLFVKLFVDFSIIRLKGDLLVREQHEVVDQNL